MDSVAFLARRAMSLVKQNDILAILEGMQEICWELDVLGFDPKTHFITQLLAHKIRNIACPDSSHTLRRAEIQVERLAEVNDGSDEEGCGSAVRGQASGTNVGRTDIIPVSLREKLQSGKRLRG
jgi:hypothetical protein